MVEEQEVDHKAVARSLRELHALSCLCAIVPQHRIPFFLLSSLEILTSEARFKGRVLCEALPKSSPDAQRSFSRPLKPGAVSPLLLSLASSSSFLGVLTPGAQQQLLGKCIALKPHLEPRRQGRSV